MYMMLLICLTWFALKNNCLGLGASLYSFHKGLEQVNWAKKKFLKFSALCNRLHRGVIDYTLLMSLHKQILKQCNRLHLQCNRLHLVESKNQLSKSVFHPNFTYQLASSLEDSENIFNKHGNPN